MGGAGHQVVVSPCGGAAVKMREAAVRVLSSDVQVQKEHGWAPRRLPRPCMSGVWGWTFWGASR